MKKESIIALTVVLLLAGVVGGIWYYATYLYNPFFEGKRLYAWKDQAIFDHDPAAREKAAETLIRAFHSLKGETRVQLVLHCCGERELPKELVPFLIVTLHATEIPSDSYSAMALSKVEGTAAIPALIEVILHDEDEHAQAGAVLALSMMEAKVEPALEMLRKAATGANEELRRRASYALATIKAKGKK